MDSSLDVAVVDLVTVAVLAFVGYRMVANSRRALRSDARRHAWAIVRGIRRHHVLAVPVLAVAVIGTASLLVQVPPLDFGWWTALGGQGNPVFGSTERTAGTPLELILPAIFVALLLPALPLLAEREEVWFRKGAEHWSTAKRVWKGLLFGLVHALVGIPIGVALALSIGGWWFTFVYLRAYRRGGPLAALAESTRAHTAYNLVLVALLVLALVADAVLRLTA